mmetsp:Transcript_53774/g.117340  ORF Transcript_53774/g.117340 Transcript_53774/m.117340 type:complete len:794 (+) Transcript_53774:191-2572(+)
MAYAGLNLQFGIELERLLDHCDTVKANNSNRNFLGYLERRRRIGISEDIALHVSEYLRYAGNLGFECGYETLCLSFMRTKDEQTFLLRCQAAINNCVVHQAIQLNDDFLSYVCNLCSRSSVRLSLQSFGKSLSIHCEGYLRLAASIRQTCAGTPSDCGFEAACRMYLAYAHRIAEAEPFASVTVRECGVETSSMFMSVCAHPVPECGVETSSTFMSAMSVCAQPSYAHISHEELRALDYGVLPVAYMSSIQAPPRSTFDFGAMSSASNHDGSRATPTFLATTTSELRQPPIVWPPDRHGGGSAGPSRSDAPAAADHTTLSEEWACTACTFLNPRVHTCCKMCATPAPRVLARTCGVTAPLDDVDTCQICFGMPIDYRPPCGHGTCVQCAARTVREALGNVSSLKSEGVPCIMRHDTQCDRHIGLDDIRPLLTSHDRRRLAEVNAQRPDPGPQFAAGGSTCLLSLEEYDKFGRFLSLAAIPESEKVHCPHCKEMSIGNPSVGTWQRCPHCSHQWQTAPQEESAAPTDDATQAYINATSKKCPNCPQRISHYHGHDCHHISPQTDGCPSCNQHFCYVCLLPHGRPRRFSGPGSFNSNCRHRSSYCTASGIREHLSYDPYPHDTRCSCPICPDCRPNKACNNCPGDCVVCRGIVRPGWEELRANSEGGALAADADAADAADADVDAGADDDSGDASDDAEDASDEADDASDEAEDASEDGEDVFGNVCVGVSAGGESDDEGGRIFGGGDGGSDNGGAIYGFGDVLFTLDQTDLDGDGSDVLPVCSARDESDEPSSD